jgi:hypothetical protein
MNAGIHSLKLLGWSALLLFFSEAASSAEYIYRDLMGNTLPAQKCSVKAEAEKGAADPYNISKYTRRFCETQGYGWYVAEEKNPGKLVCEECPGGGGEAKFKCHMEDVVVACKRLKPGSVGLFPGEG